MSTRTLDQVALLAAIIAHPDEDAPRLMFADELEENGDGARAEFIRVQCEISRYEKGADFSIPPVAKPGTYRVGKSIVLDDRYFVAKARESALLRDHEATWRAGPVCGKCKGNVTYEDVEPDLDTDDVVTHRCPDCHGTGDAGGLMRRVELGLQHTRGASEWLHKAHFRRGFIESVECRMEDAVRVIRELDDEGNDWLPSPWLRAVLTATPERALVREVVCVDVEIGDEGLEELGQDRFHFYEQHLPPPLHGLGYFPTREAAVTALARALAIWGRAS